MYFYIIKNVKYLIDVIRITASYKQKWAIITQI